MPDYQYHLKCFECGFSLTMSGPLTDNTICQPYMTKSTRLAYESGIAAAEQIKKDRNGKRN